MVYTSPAIRSLAESIHELNRRVDGLESPQLSHSSLDNFYLNVYDDTGKKTGEIGKLPDGSTGVHTIDGPTPVAPSGVTTEPGVGNFVAHWDGLFAGDAAAPLDFKHVAVHASPTADFVPTSENVVVTFSSVEPTSRVVPLKAGTYYLKTTTLSIPGKRSAATAEIEAVAGALVDEDSITEALETERTKRQEASEQAQSVLDELDGKLANLTGDSGELESIRSGLADAQEAVAASQTTASEAVTAANAASQAALEAAGLAASKGRVIVQETEPQGEDRTASNIWIQPVPDDPDTEVQEKAVTYVYLAETDEWQPTTSSELAQAAQNALDAREAAQQAQQRADTAVANAATAQSAAEAAQRSANQATTDARTAHNEAVAAQGDATEALEKYGPLDQRTIDAQAAADAAQARADEAYTEAASKLDESQVDAKITASANGKNSITRSTSNASGSGVVAGDAWYKVDSNGDTIAMWIWSGSAWVASKVRNEMIDTIDVNKLKVHDDLEVIGDAVIDKLWADGIAAKSAVFNKVTVASGDLLPDLAASVEEQSWSDLGYWTNFGINQGDPSFWVSGSDRNSRYIEYEFRMEAGVQYRFSVDVKASNAGARFYWESRLSSGSDTRPGLDFISGPGSNTYVFQGVPVTTGYQTYESVAKCRVSGTYKILIYPNHSSGTDNAGGYMWFKSARIRPMTGAVLIEDGAISADKITADAITAEKIEAEAIETPHMKANSINADRLTANSITSDKIDATSIGTELITAGTLRTAASGERLELNSQGVVLYGADAAEGERVRLGPSGENLLTIGSSTVSDTSISSSIGNFGEVSIDGQDIVDRLDQLPKGIVAWGEITDNSAYDSSTSYQRRAELQTQLRGGRLYRAVVSSHYLQVDGGSSATFVLEKVHVSWDYTNIFPDNPGSGVYQKASTRHRMYVGQPTFVPQMEFYINNDNFTGDRPLWLMYSLANSHGSYPVRLVASTAYPLTIHIEDLGPVQSPVMKRWNDNNGGGSQDTGSQIVRRTDTWGAGGYGGDVNDGSIVQGYYSGYGNRNGSWKFSSAMRSALSGSTIEKFEVYLYANHWYYGSGGTASIRPTTGGYQSWTGSAFTSSNWPRHAGRWVTVPSSWYPYIASGTYGGIGVQTSSNSSTYYGRFSGTATKFRATYRK